MAAEKKVNYTESMVETMLSMYAELGNEGLDKIATALNRPVRSVRAKLVREGVYVAAEKPVKVAKDEGPTKKELLRDLAELVSFDVDGLNGATKDAISAVLDMARALADGESEGSETEVGGA